MYKGGKGEIIKTPISLQDLRRRLYIKAKAEPAWRFWGLDVHVCYMETRRKAYRLAKANDGAPGVDGVTCEAIEAAGVEAFPGQLQEELVQQTYRPLRLRKVRIPKEGGTRQRSIPAIRNRVVQGALKLILKSIFEADCQPPMTIGPRSPRMTPSNASRKRFWRARPTGSISTFAPTLIRCDITQCWNRSRGESTMTRSCAY